MVAASERKSDPLYTTRCYEKIGVLYTERKTWEGDLNPTKPNEDLISEKIHIWQFGFVKEE